MFNNNGDRVISRLFLCVNDCFLRSFPRFATKFAENSLRLEIVHTLRISDWTLQWFRVSLNLYFPGVSGFSKWRQFWGVFWILRVLRGQDTWGVRCSSFFRFKCYPMMIRLQEGLEKQLPLCIIGFLRVPGGDSPIPLRNPQGSPVTPSPWTGPPLRTLELYHRHDLFNLFTGKVWSFKKKTNDGFPLGCPWYLVNGL